MSTQSGKIDRGIVWALLLLAGSVLLAALGPAWIAPECLRVDLDRTGLAPAAESCRWLGTDMLGRDLLGRTLLGARVSLAVGFLATLVSLVIGISYGATAGFIGGRTDALMMRGVDILFALPFLFFVIVLTVLFGRSLWLILVAIGAVEWLTVARIVRGQTLALRERTFIDAAIVGGLGTAAILRRHVIPNVFGPVLVHATLTVPQVIMMESFLSFLGLGPAPPATSLGQLIAEGAAEMEARSWMLLVPGVLLVFILFAFQLLGERLRRRHARDLASALDARVPA